MVESKDEKLKPTSPSLVEIALKRALSHRLSEDFVLRISKRRLTDVLCL
jgi:hypothetical protein